MNSCLPRRLVKTEQTHLTECKKAEEAFVRAAFYTRAHSYVSPVQTGAVISAGRRLYLDPPGEKSLKAATPQFDQELHFYSW